MRKTAQSIEEQKAVKAAPNKRGRKKGSKGHKHPNSMKNLVAPWPKGASGNPGGLPGTDVAAMICRRAIEANAQEIYKGVSESLIAGNPYALQVFGDRAYGKIANKHEHSGSIELSIGEIDAELAEFVKRVTAA